MKKADIVQKVIEKYTIALKTEKSLHVARRALYKVAGELTKDELREIWHKHLEEPTKAFYKTYENGSDMLSNGQFRWKHSTGEAMKRLLRHASDRTAADIELLKRGEYYRAVGAKRDKATSKAEYLAERNINQNVNGPISLPWPWDEDEFVVALARYIKRFEDQPQDVLRAVDEAKRMAGVK